MADLSTEQLIERRAREIANERMRLEKSLETKLQSGKTFQRFNMNTDVIENAKETVTSALWSNGTSKLTTFFTSSNQTAVQKTYYYSIYDTSAAEDKQLEVSYGHKQGSGSGDTGVSASYDANKVIYRQMAQLLLDAGQETFTFKNNVTSENVYVISIDRSRFKDRIDPGNWQLSLSELNGDAYANNEYTGSNVAVSSSNKVLTFIDDSGDIDQSVASATDAGKVYNIVSGSLVNGAYGSDTTGYGLFYPDHGIMVLNGDALNDNLSFNTVSGSGVAGDNAFKIFTSLSGSSVIDSTNYAFEGRSSEDITSTYYVARITNGDFNFSTNPSFITGSLGEFKHSIFIQNPRTYITTVGLYNNRNELLAVAKSSKPIPKTFDNEVTIKVKLDF